MRFGDRMVLAKTNIDPEALREQVAASIGCPASLLREYLVRILLDGVFIWNDGFYSQFHPFHRFVNRVTQMLSEPLFPVVRELFTLERGLQLAVLPELLTLSFRGREGGYRGRAYRVMASKAGPISSCQSARPPIRWTFTRNPPITASLASRRTVTGHLGAMSLESSEARDARLDAHTGLIVPKHHWSEAPSSSLRSKISARTLGSGGPS
jgi:hypothetical protein